jgi:para-nitrobenzyl esterase
MTLFALLDQEEVDEVALRQRIGATIGNEHGEHVLRTYQLARAARGEPPDPKELWSAMESDRFFRAPAVRLAAAHAVHQPSTFSYLFCWTSPSPLLGAAHGIELPFVFGTLDAPMVDLFAGSGPEAEHLATVVQDAWTAFARDGEPTTGALGGWPAFDGVRASTMVLGSPCGVEDAPRAEELGCWAPAPAM